MLGLNGFDFIVIDCQHGPFGIETAERMARAAAATRFAPEGARGACPCVRSGSHFVRDWIDYPTREQARTGVVALVESVEGIDQIEAIAATPELSALMAGPFDLSVSMGLRGDWRAKPVRDALLRLVAAGREHGLQVIMPVFSPDLSECRLQLALEDRANSRARSTKTLKAAGGLRRLG